MTLTTANARWALRLRAGMPVFAAATDAMSADGGAPVTGSPRVSLPPRMSMRV